MATVSSEVLALQLEKVSSVIPIAYEREDSFASKVLKAGDVEKVSYREMRLPIQINPGSRFGSASLDGGTMGRGDASKYDKAVFSPVEMRQAVEITYRALKGTDSSEKAVANVLKRELTQAMAEFTAQQDRQLMTAGDGVLATVGSVSTKTWPTTGNFTNQLLRFGQKICFYTSNLDTNRGTATITAIDYAAGTFTVDANPGGATSGDKILPEGLTGANPVWVYGLPYHMNAAATGTWLGLDKAANPNLRTPVVNASSSLLTVGQVRQLINKVLQFNGGNALDSGSWGWLLHYAQWGNWQDLGDLISELSLNNGSARESTDLVGKSQHTSSKTIAGIPAMVSINCDPTVAWLIDYKNFVRGETVAPGIFTFEDGSTYQTPYDGTTGSPQAAVLFYIVHCAQWAARSTRRAGVLYGLSRGSY